MSTSLPAYSGSSAFDNCVPSSLSLRALLGGNTLDAELAMERERWADFCCGVESSLIGAETRASRTCCQLGTNTDFFCVVLFFLVLRGGTLSVYEVDLFRASVKMRY